VQALAAWSLTLFFPPSDLRFPTSRYSDHNGAGLEAPAACDSDLLTKTSGRRRAWSVVPLVRPAHRSACNVRYRNVYPRMLSAAPQPSVRVSSYITCHSDVES